MVNQVRASEMRDVIASMDASMDNIVTLDED